MANLKIVWTHEEDARLIAGSVLRITAPEMSERFLPNRTPEAINMRLTYLRKGGYNDRGALRMKEDLSMPSTDTQNTPEGMGSQQLLLAILRWAMKNGTTPPGMSVERTIELCRSYGISNGLKLQNAG